jgi:HD-GYP domain-containing protein (c-di-GMP phosphodiesterase class II)
MTGGEIVVGRPRLVRSSQEMSLTIAAPVMGTREGEEEITAAIVAVVSFQEAFRTVQGAEKSRGSETKGEAELLGGGAPVFFVVDETGRAVAHPDARIAFSEHEMTDLKVVRDWMETGAHVESALAPFTAERSERTIEMLGSFATANLGAGARLGVIAIQDEGAALRSVTDMRQQTLVISLVAALFALVIGFFFAKGLTRPVGDLAAGAHRIAAGDFSKRIRTANRTELGALAESFNTMTDRLEGTIEDLRRAAGENRELFLGTIKALAAAIDGKDPYTRGHSERVSRFSVAIAEQLAMPADELERLRISALLHDVGKIGVDDAILKKPAPLTAAEFEQMKQHPEIGYRIMSLIPAMRDYLPGILLHHEMLNGGGYPRGASAAQIPMQARIISVADTFDACTTERPYQRAMTTEDALMILKNSSAHATTGALYRR